MTHAPTSAVPPRILLVSTYPPTQCGIANYARALRAALAGLTGTARVVVHTGAARRRLVAAYGVDSARVAVVPHGVRVAPVPRRPGGPPTILTWGLLCRGKGIERAIAALARLRATVPGVRYLVVGATHPHALAEEGEGYRRELERMVRRRGLADVVTFLDGYLGEAELRGMLAHADVVLLPYDSRDQVSSGVLVDALAAGRPVVATRFPHAVELLSGGAGRVVDHDRIDEMAAALATYLLDEGECQRAAETARHATARLGWPVVARRYLELAESIGGTAAVPAAGHTRRLVG